MPTFGWGEREKWRIHTKWRKEMWRNPIYHLPSVQYLLEKPQSGESIQWLKRRGNCAFPLPVNKDFIIPVKWKKQAKWSHSSPPKMQPNRRKGDLVMQMLSPRQLPYAQAAPLRLKPTINLCKFVICMFGRSVFHCAFKSALKVEHTFDGILFLPTLLPLRPVCLLA